MATESDPVPSRHVENKLTIKLCAVVFITVTLYTMTTTFVFSFLPHMVKAFGATEIKAGYYSGIIASCVYIGRLCCSMLWGYLADVKGKKTCSIITQACLCISTIVFGFSQSINFAAGARLFQGATMGQYIVANAMIADACNENNVAIGMSIVITSYSIGFTLGPSLGGFLVFPAEHYGKLFSRLRLFTNFPILLPAIVLSMGQLVGLILTVLYIPSDHGLTNQNVDTVDNNAMQSAPTTSVENTSNADMNSNGANPEQIRFRSSILEKLRGSKLWKLFRMKQCILASVIYGIFAFLDVGFIEMFPVLAATERKYKGMNFSESKVGIILMAASVTVIPFQLTILPKLNTKYGSKKVFIASSVLFVIAWPLLPVIAYIDNTYALWSSLILLIFVIRILAFLSYLSLNVLVNRSVGPDLRGSVNGLLMTIAALGRLSAPLIFGTLYSWSLTNIKSVPTNLHPLGFPFNQFFMFFVLSIFSALSIILATRLKEPGQE